MKQNIRYKCSSFSLPLVPLLGGSLLQQSCRTVIISLFAIRYSIFCHLPYLSIWYTTSLYTRLPAHRNRLLFLKISSGNSYVLAHILSCISLSATIYAVSFMWDEWKAGQRLLCKKNKKRQISFINHQ